MYAIVEEKLYLEDVGSYTTFGIQCQDGQFISDVCTERERLEAFVQSLNDSGLEPVQLEDAVTDFLSR